MESPSYVISHAAIDPSSHGPGDAILPSRVRRRRGPGNRGDSADIARTTDEKTRFAKYAEAQKMQRLFLIICMVRMVKMLLR